MDIQEPGYVPIKTHARVEVRNRDGIKVNVAFCTNLITELGDALIASRMSNASTAAPTHMAIGSGTGRTAASTTMASETARVALTSTTQGTGGNDNVVTYVCTFDAGTGTGVVSEVALFNASSAGVMFNYLDGFTSFTKAADLSVTITLTIRYGAST